MAEEDVMPNVKLFSMRHLVLVGVICPYTLLASQALLNVADFTSANAALADYTNNVLRIEVASTQVQVPGCFLAGSG